MTHAVFVFCADLAKHPAAGHVLHALKKECTLVLGEGEIDGH